MVFLNKKHVSKSDCNPALWNTGHVRPRSPIDQGLWGEMKDYTNQYKNHAFPNCKSHEEMARCPVTEANQSAKILAAQNSLKRKMLPANAHAHYPIAGIWCPFRPCSTSGLMSCNIVHYIDLTCNQLQISLIIFCFALYINLFR